MITPFDSAELTTLDSGTILTDTINSRDILKGIEIENFTPAFFEIEDDNNVVQVSIPPWSMKTSDLPKSQNFTVRTVSGSPVLTTNTVPNSAYRFGYLTYSYNVGLSTQALLTLAVIGADVTIGSGSVTVDNTAGSPVLNNPLQADSLNVAGISIASGGSYSATIGAVVQRIIMSINNNGSAATGIAFLNLTLGLQSGGALTANFPVNGLSSGSYSPLLVLELGSGLNLASVEFVWSDSASNPITLEYSALYT